MMQDRRAGSGGGKYKAKSPIQGRKGFNPITKTIHLAHLVILFIFIYYLCLPLAILSQNRPAGGWRAGRWGVGNLFVLMSPKISRLAENPRGGSCF